MCAHDIDLDTPRMLAVEFFFRCVLFVLIQSLLRALRLMGVVLDT